MSEPRGDEGMREKGLSRWQCGCREKAHQVWGPALAAGAARRGGQSAGPGRSSLQERAGDVAGRGCHAPPQDSPDTRRAPGIGQLFNIVSSC